MATAKVHFEKRPVLTTAWDLYKQSAKLVRDNFGIFGLLYVIPAFFSLFGNIGHHQATVHGDWGFKGSAPGLNWVTWIGIGSAIFLLIAAVSLIIITLTQAAALQAAEGKQPTLGGAWQLVKPVFWRLLGAYILSGLAVLLGFVLFIVPGIIMLRRYYLVPYMVLDQKGRVWESMEKAAAMTKPYAGSVYRVIGLSILLSLAGWLVSALSWPLLGSLVGLALGFFFTVVPPLRYLELKSLYKPSSVDRAAQSSASSQTESSA